MEKLVVVVPIYEDTNSVIEKYSLKSLYRCLSRLTPICFIGPDKLRHKLQDKVNEANDNHFVADYKLYDDSYFVSPQSYSKLLTNYKFYKEFDKYKYMLIYQTDCYMLRDELSEWMAKDYDYVGAPILVITSGWKNVPTVGNGGCSLRKLSWFLDATNPEGQFQKRFAKEIETENKANKNAYIDYEDLYFAELCAYLKGCKIPNYKMALNFSWDMNPDIAYMLNDKKAPCFLHAFDKNLRWYVTKMTDFNDEELWEECENKWEGLHKYYMSNIENPKTFG